MVFLFYTILEVYTNFETVSEGFMPFNPYNINHNPQDRLDAYLDLCIIKGKLQDDFISSYFDTSRKFLHEKTAYCDQQAVLQQNLHF